MRRLWRVRHEDGRPGDLILARGQRTIDLLAVGLLIVLVAVALAGIAGVAHAIIWAWATPVPWLVRGLVTLSLAAVVLIGLLGWRVVRER